MSISESADRRPVSSTVLRPTTLTNSSRPTSSAPSRFPSSTVQVSAFYSNSTATVSVTQLSTCSSLSPTSTAAISTSSVLSSISTSVISTIQSSSISSDSTSTTSITTTDSQPSVVPSPAASTTTPVDPPANSACNSPPPYSDADLPPKGYIDVNPGDVDRHADNFCTTDFPQDCPINGYANKYNASFVDYVVGYNISINPVPFCSGPSTFTCEYPLPNLDYSCSYSLKTAWQNCEWCRNREKLIIIDFRHYQSRHGR